VRKGRRILIEKGPTMAQNVAIAVGLTSTPALPANAERASFTVYNPSPSATIWIGLDAAATVAPPSIPVPPLSSVTEAYLGAITLIGSSATDVTVMER
jgi:hypothetical protein